MPLKDNKMFRTALILTAVVALTAAIGVVVSAQMQTPRGQAPGQGPEGPAPWWGPGPGMRGPGGPMRGPGGPGGPFGQIVRGLGALGLSEEQRTKVRAIMDTHKDEFAAIAERMMKARQDLHAVVTAGTVDEAAIRAAAEAVGAVEADAAVLHARVHAEVFAVLTPEQQQKARELRSQMEQRMKERPRLMRQRLDKDAGPTRGKPQAV